MANDTTRNPWILDTAALITTEPIRITKIRFHPNAADNDCVIEDALSGTIWTIRAIASAANNESVGCEEIDFNPAFPCSGFRLRTLDGGKVYVYRASVY